MDFISKLDYLICLLIATRINKGELIKLSKVFGMKTTKAREGKHVCRNVTKHRSGKKDKELKRLTKINKRIHLVFTYKHSLEHNKELYEEVSDLKIPMEILKKWLVCEITDLDFTRFYLTKVS